MKKKTKIKKKIKDLTVEEIKTICRFSRDCHDCPLHYKGDCLVNPRANREYDYQRIEFETTFKITLKEILEGKDFVVRCRTQDEALELFTALSNSLIWKEKVGHRLTPIQCVQLWGKYKKETCYSLENGCVDELEYYKKCTTKTIVEFKDIYCLKV